MSMPLIPARDTGGAVTGGAVTGRLSYLVALHGLRARLTNASVFTYRQVSGRILGDS